jgi:hypothetical protein
VTNDATAAVTWLLTTANLTVSDQEFEKFTQSYLVLRNQADGLYLPDLDPEEPALSFDPTVDSTAT